MKKFYILTLCFLFIRAPVLASYGVVSDSVYKKLYDYVDVSVKDVRLYKSIFKDIEKEKISSAIDKIKKLDSDILLGHVWAQIYFSKTYKSKVSELTKWLDKYKDLPQARSIYNLAVSKAGKDAIDNPWGEKFPIIYSPYSWYNNQYENLSESDRKYVRRQVYNFRRYINKGKTKAAREILENKKFRMTIPDREYDAMSVTLATVYLLDNYNKLAWQWVQKATKRSDDSMGYWIGGLASWKMKKYKNAANYFTKLGAKTNSDEWLVSASAYWAYRSYLKLGNKVEARKWLKVASFYKRTFYGMLANYQLGQSWYYSWENLSFINDYTKDTYINDLLSSPVVYRILLLMQMNNVKLADKEIRFYSKSLSSAQKETLLRIAEDKKMHSIAIYLSNDLKNNENVSFYDVTAYPVPDWKPRDGWKVNRAFVWALVRQESSFFPKASSRAGAKGLMQLMPKTAFYITKNKKINRDNSVLFDTEYNLELGQKYVSYLAEKPFINKNMFFVIVAYNAGPGNLYKWLKRVKYNNDPLLFIELIPAKETRIYIERVMANYWMYEARFGKEHKSLKQLSKGKWPKI